MSMSPVLSFSEQATYDVVNNLGSLAARFIFRPIEESSYFYFTQTIARDVALKDQELVNICLIYLPTVIKIVKLFSQDESSASCSGFKSSVFSCIVYRSTCTGIWAKLFAYGAALVWRRGFCI